MKYLLYLLLFFSCILNAKSKRDSTREAISILSNINSTMLPRCQIQQVNTVLSDKKSSLWNKNEVFENTNVYTVSEDQVYYGIGDFVPTHTLNLNLIFLKKSHWTQEEVYREAVILADFFKQCSIKVNVDIVETEIKDAEADILYSRNGTANNSRNALGLNTPEYAKNSSANVLFFNGFKDNPAQSGTSSSVSSVGESCPHKDFSWVAYTNGISVEDKKYSVTAHEMIHNLGNIPHGPNFIRNIEDRDYQSCDDSLNYKCPFVLGGGTDRLMLGGNAGRNNNISQALCTRIKSHPLVKELEPSVEP